jgi:hypothetical protein
MGKSNPSETSVVREVDGVLVWARNVRAGQTFAITPEQLSKAKRR